MFFTKKYHKQCFVVRLSTCKQAPAGLLRAFLRVNTAVIPLCLFHEEESIYPLSGVCYM